MGDDGYMLKKPTICYLCAKPLTEPINVDHVPPRQLFAKSLRKKHNLAKLVTINVHAACNTGFGPDEQYFVQTLLPFAHGSYSGNAVFKESMTKFHAGEHKLLMNTVLKEFERNPSGLILPKGKVAKRFHGNRLRRVAWKIVRGLYFYHFATALPDDWTTDVTVTAPGEKLPDHFAVFMSVAGNTEYGAYPGIFAYRFHKFTEANDLNYWALLLWDRIIITVAFHSPNCSCPQCSVLPVIDTTPLRD